MCECVETQKPQAYRLKENGKKSLFAQIFLFILYLISSKITNLQYDMLDIVKHVLLNDILIIYH